jgi:2-hydroxy-3-keto-5-methylthiopentenyl-1-phosphate phosphatase
MNFIVLCDFDGTITIQDTAELVLDNFAQGDWKSIDRQFENREITLEECLKKEFSLVKVSEQEIIGVLKNIRFRNGFNELAIYCRQNRIPVIVVSAGLDFVIEHFLKFKGWSHMVETYMAKTTATAQGIRFRFPKRRDKTSANFKQDFVKKSKSEGRKIVFIGNGAGDFDAAKEADCAFAIKNSRLEKLFEKHGMHFRRVTDFCQVVEVLERALKKY